MQPTMTLEERVAVLRSVDALAGQSAEQLVELARRVTERAVAPGTVLAQEDRPGEMLVVTSGEALATRDGTTTGPVGPGTLIGATPATVTAVTLMHLLVLADGHHGVPGTTVTEEEVAS